MEHKKVSLKYKEADGYIVPLGPVNLVMIITDIGILGCGAFDVAALEKYDYPAARVKSESGLPIATLDDLQEGIVKDANSAAGILGITAGMKGKEALDLL
jgi:uncharacterized protein YunC (DUF1805 family)